MPELLPAIAPAKKHFEILDGLRGVAALSVVIFHFMEVVYVNSENLIGNGFLAVDFFFCLSGFVIGYAYDDRMAKMGVLEFFKARIIRLHPLVILGSVLGLLAYLFDPFATHPGLISNGRIALVFIASIFLIPFPVMTERALNLFSFNAPAWSLFWEYVANIFYALILFRLGKKSLVLLAILAAIGICLVMNQAGNLLGGWGRDTFWHGSARISYSFLAGLLVYRFNWVIKNRLGFLGIALLLFAAFIIPFGSWNWISETFVVLFYFPFLIALGAGAILKPAFKSICVFAGNISYPLYMTHYTFIWMYANYYAANKPSVTQLAVIIIISAILMLGFAYIVMIGYDTPVRKYLSSKWRRTKN